ncbi:fimbria/pilus periplasmic chaperone [Paraburkholderia edwinii]|uniref:fimbria/pilus periplasmic chaperone n=1 Tax=Paraburkholderia edwinii TaxID=2861782 RepID=UPI001FE6ED40|nr:fimbria/pilus periplasmic chaperone [Paraburkholderia edwinii]
MPAEASVVIAATRVIYDANEPEVTLKLSNEGQSPALVQSWVDAGDVRGAPSNINVPFTVTPPISRIDPSRSQTLRLVYTGEALPQDRESVFWLDVLEVPPKPAADSRETNHLQLAFRSRIKLFFRPAHLQGTPDTAAAQLTWRLTQTGGQLAIEVHNPTAFHVSLTEITVHAAGKAATFDDGGMIGPGETHAFQLKGEVADAPDATVHYQWLNDYGGPGGGDAPLGPGTAAVSK